MALIFMVVFSSSCTVVSDRVVDGTFVIEASSGESWSLPLDGIWEFHWEAFPDPQNPGIPPDYIAVPGAWNGGSVNRDALPGQGYATYTMTLISPEEQDIALRIPRVFTAHEIWINGRLVASAGTVGTDQMSSQPEYLPQVATFGVHEGDNQVTVRVSNFHHRSGGILENIFIGDPNTIAAARSSAIATDFLIFGSLLMLGIYHLVIYLFRRQDPSYRYFGAFSIVVATRTLLAGERFIMTALPFIGWEMAHNLQTLSFYLGVPLLLMFFQSTFRDLIASHVVRAIQVVSLSFAAFVVITPVRIFTLINPIFQLFTIFVAAYLLVFLARVLQRPRMSTGFMVVGASVLVMTTLHDLVFLSVWLNDAGPSVFRNFVGSGNLSSFGQMIFVLTHSLVLAAKYSEAFEEREMLGRSLAETNANLDHLVRDRTKELERSQRDVERKKEQLEASNRILEQLSLKDPLTGLWNRRKLGETLSAQWRKCVQDGSYLSLILIDIDHFKEFNDTYGHDWGDKCLALVASALQKNYSRASDLVVRYGGEEFVLVLPSVGEEEAMAMADRARKIVRNLEVEHRASPICPYLTVSVGVATCRPGPGGTSKDLFTAADEALYRAKDAGKDRVDVGQGNGRRPLKPRYLER